MTTITERLDAAIEEVTLAEGVLAGLIRDLEAGVRAEKVLSSEVVTQAFARLRTARAALAEVREAIARDPV